MRQANCSKVYPDETENTKTNKFSLKESYQKDRGSFLYEGGDSNSTNSQTKKIL